MDNSHQNIKPKAFKVIIVGPQAVGKSSILIRLAEDKFNTAYLATVGIDFKTYMARVEGKPYSLQIWDTAGQQKFRALTNTYYKGSQGCVCVFDLADKWTIQRSIPYIQQAVEEGLPKECIFLVGNKSDAISEPNVNGVQLAEKYKIQYMECSAKEGKGVGEVFEKLAKNLVGSYGANIRVESGELQTQINIKEGRQGCCGRG